MSFIFENSSLEKKKKWKIFGIPILYVPENRNVFHATKIKKEKEMSAENFRLPPTTS